MTSDNPKSTSREEDARRAKDAPTRMSTTHGGELVEAVSPEELESFNDANCKHPKLVRDETETDFNAFTCANPSCNEVFMYDKN